MLTNEIRAAMDRIISSHSELGVSVKYGSQTCTGLRVLTNKQTDFNVLGQLGTTIGTVRVRSDQIDEPDRGALIIVDGKQVYVTQCRTSGGIRVIEYSETQPIEGL